MFDITIIEKVLPILTIFADILIGIFILNMLFNRKKLFSLFEPIQNKYLFYSFIVALTATLGSLFYSEIMGYEPCVLCWYQRIFMYPQVILLYFAHRKNHKSMTFYSLILSLIGFLIAGYHYLSQVTNLNLPCSAVGYSASCSEFYTLDYGYITIPVMALSAFGLMIIGMILGIRKN